MIRKKYKRIQALRHQLSKQRAELKKRKLSFKKRRQVRLENKRKDIQTLHSVQESEPIRKISPTNFSFIDNTNELLEYFNECQVALHKKQRVLMDISNIKNLSSDAIALLVASVNNKDFIGKYGAIKGTAPNNNKLAKLFIESGFYKYVDADKRLKYVQKDNENLLHKESHFKVQPELAKNACLYGTKHVFGITNTFPELYEMFIEAMSNTNNHAGKDGKGEIKWWLYAYNSADGKTCYSFIDLGVGIFDSLPVGRYKKFKNIVGLLHNADLVQDLLDGKIKSSEKIDRNIRGKGIPQIARNSEDPRFGRAYIVSNNVKINLKNRTTERLNDNFKGTMLYWELINPQKIIS